MQFIPVKTRPLLPPQDDIYPVLDKYLPALKEGDVVVISSKVLGIHQGRCTPIKDDTREEKERLVLQEADIAFDRTKMPHDYMLTIKNGIFVGAAGIDKSNGNGYYVFWPERANELCKEICQYLKKKHRRKKLAVITIDSTSMPLRLGTIGATVGFFGLRPLQDYRGHPDIFGRKLKVTRANIVDAISVMANLVMGEADEQTPFVIGRGLDFVDFTDRHTYKQMLIDPRQDIFYPLLKNLRSLTHRRRR